MHKYFYIILSLLVVFILQTLLWVYVLPSLYIQLNMQFLEIFLIGLIAFFLLRKFFRNEIVKAIYIFSLVTTCFNFVFSNICSSKFLDSSIHDGSKLVSLIENFRNKEGKYPNNLDEIVNSAKYVKTPINTSFLYINRGSYYFLQFDWIDNYIGYFDYNQKKWLLKKLSNNKKSKVIEYKLRTW